MSAYLQITLKVKNENRGAAAADDDTRAKLQKILAKRWPTRAQR